MTFIPNPHRRRLVRLSATLALTLLAAGSAVGAGATGTNSVGARAGAHAHAGSAGSSGEAALMTGRAGGLTLAAPAAIVRGIDVSHWQGPIDWSRVAATGRAFAFLKATDDTDYVDPTFSFNRAQAKANGLAVGAYHFARPDPAPGDATREARWFATKANPKPGELLPVLDIETNDGLTQDEMVRWARRWIAEVRDLTGVTPLVYTSPYGWLSRFGDSRLIARDGSPLWVAHWNVAAPIVPAADWDGNGWQVWQHSSTGHVAGIGGRVDLDVLGGSSLARLTIRRLSLTVEGDAGTVTSAPAGLGCRTVCAKNVDPDTTVTLTAVPDDDAFFTGWEGDCSGNAPTCTVTMAGNHDVTAGFVTDITAPKASLDPPSGFTDAAVVRFDEIVRHVSSENVVLRREGGGVGVAVTRTCRSGGGATVPCSTGSIRSVSLKPARPLVPGRDYVAVVNPGGTAPIEDLIGNPATTTPLDFEASTEVEQQRPPVVYSWCRVDRRDAFGGSYIVERTGDAQVSFAFQGPWVRWYTVTGPSFGRAEVRIDGRLERVVDLWDAHRHAKVSRTFGGLRPGRHTITVTPTGHSRPRATDHLVAVDAFGTAARGIVRTPITVQRWHTLDAAGASGGTLALSNLGGAAAEMHFDGVGVDWITTTGPDRGLARIYIDGALERAVDLASPHRTFGVVERVDGLTDGTHVLRIVVGGTTGPASTGTLVEIDRFDVLTGP
jgi:lysozyme